MKSKVTGYKLKTLLAFIRNNFYLIAIICVAFFFRLWKFSSLYTFEHDQDLYAWIVKDIVVDHHVRLIGQLTSIDGVFIGAMYYYFLAPFFVLFRMDPLGVIVPVAIFTLVTVFSIYYIFTRLFNKNLALITSFLYAASLPLSLFDRWIVPTQLTILWSIWYLYALFLLLAGNQHVFILAAILISLIWHIHVAFLPLLILLPGAVLLSRKSVNVKYLIISTLLLIVTSSPLILFEIRHNFIQTRGVIAATYIKREGEAEGFVRLRKVLDGASDSLSRPYSFNKKVDMKISYLVLVFLFAALSYKKIISGKQLAILAGWILITIFAQQISKRANSDYYFNNVIVISLFLVAAFISSLKLTLRAFFYFLLLAFLLVNFFLFWRLRPVGNGYIVKKSIVSAIKQDSKSKNFQCVGINFIAGPGTNVGFRYLSWFYNLNLVQGSERVPVYNITIPYRNLENEQRFDGLGLIVAPEKSYDWEKACQGNKLLEPLEFTN